MKKILFLMVAISAGNGFAQLREASWFSLGIENVAGSYKGVSPIFVDDNYKLNNPMTCTYNAVHTKNYMTVDISGLFYPILAEMLKAKDGEGYNLYTYTNQSAQRIVNRISFAFSISKLLGNNDGKFVSAFGWQANTRLFGLADFRVKEKNSLSPDTPDAGPVSGRRTLNLGVNYQLMHQFGNNIFMRTGIFAEGMVGTTKGAMVYPEASIILNWRFLALIGSARYDLAFLTSKPQMDYYTVADKSTIAQALRLNVSLGFDIGWKKHKAK